MIFLVAFLLLIELYGYTRLINYASSCRLSVAPAIYVSLIVISLFAADFLGLMWAASWLLHGVGVGSAIIALLHRLRSADSPRFPIETGHVFFAAVILLLTAKNAGAFFYSWDEFSHWGTVIKTMAEARTFHFGTSSPLYFKDYPPATALFAFHVTTIAGYSEPVAILSYNLIQVSYLSAVIAPAFRLNTAIGIVVTVIAYRVVIELGHGWSSVNIDHILSIMVAGTIATYFSDHYATKRAWQLPLMLCALALVKQSGSYLALLIAGVVLVDLIAKSVSFGGKGRLQLHLSGIGPAVWVMALFLIPIGADKAWKTHVARSGIEAGWGSLTLGPLAQKAWNCCTSEREITVAREYFARFIGVEPANTASGSLFDFACGAFDQLFRGALLDDVRFWDVPLWISCTIIGIWLAFVLLLYKGKEAFRRICLIASLAAGMVLFSFSILASYLFAFSEYEAVRLASFERYHNTFALALLLVALFDILVGTMNSNPRLVSVAKSRLMFAPNVVAMIVVSIAAIVSVKQGASEQARYVHDIRQALLANARPAIELTPADKKVYIAWLHSSGFEFWLLKYEFLPRVTNLVCFSFQPEENTDTLPQSCLYPKQHLKDVLAGYDYLYIGKGIEEFRENYGELIDPQVPLGVTYFSVVKSGSSMILRSGL